MKTVGTLREQLQVQAPVRVFTENVKTTNSPLRDVMRYSGNNDTSDS